MTTIELYRKHKAGQVSKNKFLYEVRKDANLPWVTNLTSYDDAVKILKNNRIISEADANIATDPAVDRVNPYYLKRGVQMLLDKEKELTNDSYIKALNKAALMLQKNPHVFDEEMFANAKDVEKADTKLETQEVKKANHKDKANEMKKVKVKALKEAAIGELKDYLKKKEQINEDSHWKHNIGSEVHTPDGEGKIVDIVGSTFTVEMEDGTRRDYQINTVDHFTQKAQEQEPKQGAQDEPTVKDMWANWDKVVASGKNPEMTRQFGGELRYKPEDIQTLLARLKEFISKNKGDKDKMGKLKERIKKLKESLFTKGTGPGSSAVVASSEASKKAVKAQGFREVPNTQDVKPA